MGKYVNTADIAKALNLSPSTVSRALNDHYSISDKTKKKVLAYAQKVGYQKNLNAATLLQKSSSVIGVLVPEATSYFFATIISGIKEVVAKAGYDMIIMQSNESYEQEVRNLNYLCSRRVDGILYSPTVETTDFKHLEVVIKNKIPFVNLDREIPNFNCPKVLSDDSYGAKLAVEHLWLLGARRIAHIAGPKLALNAQNRWKAYKEVIEDKGLRYQDNLVSFSDFRIKSSLAAVKQVFDQKPDAIFAINDEIALGCMSEARKRGLSVPEDILIIGFDDEIYSQFFNPSLSTIQNPIEEMGEKAANLCLQQIANYDESTFERIVLKPKLIPRDSTKKRRIK